MIVSARYGPTLYQLEKAGRLLDVGCYHCGTVIRLRPSSIGLGLQLTVSEAADLMNCSWCGKSNKGRFHFVYGQPARRC